MLQLSGVKAGYGAVQVLHGVDLVVGDEEVVALLGANGVGKSTTLRVISGLLRPTAGQVLFGSESITGLRSDLVVARGVSHCPEGRRLFSNLTVEQNLWLGGFTRKDKASMRKDLELALQRFPVLAQRSAQVAGTLSGGEQQMLAIARALLSRPRLLLMDEPSLGLSPILVEQIMQVIQEISREGVAVLLVEQNARQALKIADRAYVMEQGAIALSGSAAELSRNDSVRRAYLGGEI